MWKTLLWGMYEAWGIRERHLQDIAFTSEVRNLGFRLEFAESTAGASDWADRILIAPINYE